MNVEQNGVGEMNDTEIMLVEIKTDLVAIRTDVTWLKRLFSGMLIVCGALFGIDATGMI